MKRAFRRMRLRRRPGRGGAKLLVLLAVLLVGAVWFAEWGLGSVSPELTQEAARSYVLSCVNRAVEESLGEGRSFVEVDRDQTGNALAVRTDTAALNQLRGQILSRLEESLNGRVSVHVPAGSLTGIALLNGRGFPVPLALGLEGSADLSFHTEFVSAGINQSCHRVTMTVTAQVYSQSKRFETQVETESTTVLAETVVVGSVPQAALLETG